MTTPSQSYIIVDATALKCVARTIFASDDDAARRQAQAFLEHESTSDAVTLFRCEESRIYTVCEIHRAAG